MARRSRRIRPDMTPLIDCVFLLLVFFMATSVFKQDESVLRLTLPETKSEEKRESRNGLYVELSGTELAVDGRLCGIDDLRAKASTRGADSPVAVKIDKATPYERVAEVLDVLQTAGLRNVQLVNELEKAAP